VTEGHFQVWEVRPFVPSRSLKTLVTGCIAVFEPDMRSTLKLVHLPVVSKFHERVQSPPSLKLWPGPGAVGTTSATQEPAARKSDKTRAEIMMDAIGNGKKRTKLEKMWIK